MTDSTILTRSRALIKMSKPEDASTSANSAVSSDTVPVYKWNLSFDGTGNVHNFIERVNDLSLSRNVSTASLFSSAVELFTGHALDWFRVNRSSFNSWTDIVNALKEEFELLDHERRLVAQIRATYQHQKENLGSFITRVLILNNQLSSKLPDDEILEILQCNMLPRYIQKLSLSVISDINCLKSFGKMIELADSRSDSRPSPQIANTSYNNNVSHSSSNNAFSRGNNRRSQNFNNVRFDRSANQNNLDNTNFRNHRQSFEFNKRSPSNMYSREVRCFRCGRPGVKAPSCNCRHPKN